MAYLLVFLASLAVGGAVFAVSLRRPAVTTSSSGFDPAEPPADGPGTTYLPVATAPPSWHTRLTGALGLLISIAVAAIALAVGIYAFGSAIGRLIGGAVGGDGA